MIVSALYIRYNKGNYLLTNKSISIQRRAIMKKTTLVLAALLSTTLTFANPIESLKVVSEDTQAHNSTGLQTVDFGAIRGFLEGQMSNLDLPATEIAASEPTSGETTTELDIDFQGMRDFLNRRLNQK